MKDFSWGVVLTIFIAVVLADIFRDALLSKIGNKAGVGTHVSAVTQSPAQPVVVYSNPVQQYLKENYPNAR